jgi:hypothetical protein
VNLGPASFTARTKELILDGAGSCIAFLHADTSYVYLHTGIGLVRMAHAELRR